MDLYLIRHADALALGDRGIASDAERPLSDLGENQARALGKGLRHRGMRFDKVVTSPYLRARQTADALLSGWPAPVPEVLVCEDLVPDAKPKKLARFLTGGSIALVGHMPHLGILTAWLIGSKKAQINLAKAGVAHVACGDEFQKGAGTLVWLVTPEWLKT